VASKANVNGLRICFVMPGFPIERDEPGLAAVVDLIERVADVHDVEVVSLRHPSKRAAYSLAGARVHALGLGRARGARGRARVLLRGVRAVTTLHKRRPIDVVHALWADEAGAVATTAARMIDRPSIVSIMGGELTALPDIGYGAAIGRGGRWTVRAAVRRADMITVGSTYLRLQAEPLVGAADSRIHDQPLGVDLATYYPAEAPPPSQTVLFAGSLEPVKDPEAAIRAFAHLAETHPDTRLVVVGSGSLRGRLAALATELGVSSRVDLVGRVSRDRMPEIYRAASVLLITSRHEAQSMVAVEAAASGLPVVGTSVGVMSDLGDAARPVPDADPEAVARELTRILDDPAEAARMRVAARAIAAARYDQALTAAAVLERYATLVSSRVEPGGT
jgi:glycosyltransferase involved in cell wall biosynthesis